MRDDAGFFRPFPYGIGVSAGPGMEQRCRSCEAHYELADGPGISLCMVCLDELEMLTAPRLPIRRRRSTKGDGTMLKVKARWCGILGDAKPGDVQTCRDCQLTYVLLAGLGWARCAFCFRPFAESAEPGGRAPDPLDLRSAYR